MVITTSHPTQSTLRVLVVEDDDALRRSICKLLGRLGLQTEEAKDGVLALNALQDGHLRLDLVLSDIRMPNMDGITLLEKIRRSRGELPVALMTGQAELGDSIMALKLGAFDFLTKPFGEAELRDLIRRLPRSETVDLVLSGSARQCEERLRIEMVSSRNAIYDVLNFVRSRCVTPSQRLGLNLNNVALCLAEALQNAVIHGNMNISSQLKEGPAGWQRFEEAISAAESDPDIVARPVHIELTTTHTALAITVRDEGAGFDYGQVHQSALPDVLLEHGRGLALIRVLADEMAFEPPGNCIRFLFRARH